ncbi:MAG: response regulator transcription factor [Chitinophagaceae bacterium]|nr:response regulator transcription factor [Chitinophagaceae bacterium]
MKISCVIVEDEPLAAERLKNYVLKLPYLQLLSSFDNGIDALAYIKSNRVDLIFLDINMTALSGIQLLETKAISSEVIITTAYQEYALKGFDLKVTDYLLKPFTFERFIQAVERVQKALEKNIAVSERKSFFVKTEYRFEKILLDEVLYIEGMRDYRRIVTVSKKIMTLHTFTAFEAILPHEVICRVHKSYMVAVDKINTVEKDIIRIGNIEIPISETYRKAFFELIRNS